MQGRLRKLPWNLPIQGIAQASPCHHSYTIHIVYPAPPHILCPTTSIYMQADTQSSSEYSIGYIYPHCTIYPSRIFHISISPLYVISYPTIYIISLHCPCYILRIYISSYISYILQRNARSITEALLSII